MASNPTRPAARLSRKTIITRAIEIADRDGIADLSMRKLAAALSVTPMALYWHFANKRALLDAMAEHVATEVDLSDDPDAPWQERLRAVLRTVLGRFRAHPWMPALVKGRIIDAPGYLATVEVLFDAIRTAGYDEDETVRTADFAIDCIGAMVATSALYGDERLRPTDDQLEAQRHLIESVAGDYPRVGEAAVPMSEPEDPERYIALGIEILVRGIEAAAPGRSSDRPA